MREVLKRTMTVCALTAAMATAGSAQADGVRFTPNWEKLADVINDGGSSLFPREQRSSMEAAASTAGATQPDAFFAFAPRLSLVARDWSGAQLLWGGHVAVTDLIRLSRSSRMIVPRLRLSGGRFAPFMQIGFGQWRVDTDLMPVFRRDLEMATQVGAGFELRLAPGWAVAMEHAHTFLYSDDGHPERVSGPRLWGSFVAMRGAF